MIGLDPAELGPLVGKTAHAALVASAVEPYQPQSSNPMHEHYDFALEARYFALLLDVASARVTPTDAAYFVCDEIRRAFATGVKRGQAGATNDKAPLRTKSEAPTQTV